MVFMTVNTPNKQLCTVMYTVGGIISHGFHDCKHTKKKKQLCTVMYTVDGIICHGFQGCKHTK